MKRLRLFRFLLLLLTAFVLIFNSTNAEVSLQQVSDTEAMVTAHTSMMMPSGEEHCDSCPDSGHPIPAAAPCVKCIPWMQVQLFAPAIVPFAQPPYVPLIQPLSWIDHQSLPWKPPRLAVLNG